MKVNQAALLPATLSGECALLGERLARLRAARQVRQSDAALRAGLSRNTAYRIEKGDPGVALGQVLRYLDAIAPGSTLLDLLTGQDPALRQLAEREKTRRVRGLSSAKLRDLDF